MIDRVNQFEEDVASGLHFSASLARVDMSRWRTCVLDLIFNRTAPAAPPISERGDADRR
jgi:hypothetical protein